MDRMRRPGMQLERKASVGDILTCISILGAAFAWSIATYHDRLERQRTDANKVRAAAASTLVKLDRYEEISLSTYDQCEPSFVDTKELLVKKFDVDEGNRFLWKAIAEVELAARQKLLDDHIELGYVDLYTYDPSAKDTFTQLFNDLDGIQDQAYGTYHKELQEYVLTYKGVKVYQPGELYNGLEITAMQNEGAHRRVLEKRLAPVRCGLIRLIQEQNKPLLSNPRFATSTECESSPAK
jgi:hypothetical protein